MNDLKEDIEILEELTNQKYSERLLNTLSMVKEEDEVNILTIYEKQAIENLIKAYRKLKNKKYIMSISCDGECQICEHYKNEYLLENESIPKSLIKEKIEELKERADEDNLDDFIRIQVLEELLKGEEK